MRYITLGGHKYPIRATVQVDAEISRKYNDALIAAEDAAESEADEKDLNEAKRKRLIDRRKRLASRAFLTDQSNSLEEFAMLINAAVDYKRIMCGQDISGEVYGYPITAQKIAMIATVDDLNSEETLKAVAEEFSECHGGEKNVPAEQLMDAARILTKSL